MKTGGSYQISFDLLLMKVTMVFFGIPDSSHSFHVGSNECKYSNPVGCIISIPSTEAFAWSKVTCDNVVVEAKDR